MLGWTKAAVIAGLIALAGCGQSAAEPKATPKVAPAPRVDPRVGPVSHLTPSERRAFAFTDDFEALPDPQPGHWRFEHPEPSEDVLAFRAAGPHEVVQPRRVVYILPIGDLAAEGGPPLPELEAHARRFFGLDVEILDPVTVATVEADERDNDGVRQLHAPDVLDYLRTRVPWNAYCVLGLTMEDLYPGPSWNYVFGLASTHDRVGVFSFRRYDPRFYDARAPRDSELILLRGLKVMTHELGHMFGMGHCDHFRCIMNGSNHVGELDEAPLHLCPVCLRKLHFVTGINLQERYEALRDAYTDLGISDEAVFARRRLWRMDPD